MSDAGFLQALADDPEDDTTRLVYADWLEERGDPRAPWVRDLAIWRWMGPHAESPVSALMESAVEADFEQAKEVAAVLQRIGSAAVPGVIEALQRADNLAKWASSTLRGFDPEDLERVLPTIRRWAAEGNESAVTLLAGLPSEAPTIAPTLFDHLGYSRWTINLLADTGPETAPLMLAAAPHLDPTTLAYTAERLQSFGAPVVPLLRETLSDNDVRRRLLAAVALASHDPEVAAPHLVELLENDSLRQDIEQCRVLSCIRGLGQVLTPFAPRLRRHLWGAERGKWTWLEILEMIDDPAVLSAELFDRTRSEKWEERAEAIEILGQLDGPPPGALESALEMLSDSDERVRRRAMEAIARLAPRGHSEAIAAVLEHFRREGPCRESIWVLGALGAPNFVADLVPLCEHEDDDLRIAAVGTLASADGPDADVARVLCRALDREPDGYWALDDLFERPTALAFVVEEILECVRGDRPSRYHLQLVRRLDHLLGDEQAALLCRHLSADDDLATVALEELSYILDGRPPLDAVPDLLRILDEGGRHAETAAAQLAWLGRPAIPELARRLQDEQTQELAARSLGLMHAEAADACDALIEALRSGSDRTRSNAATALGNIGQAAKSAVPELRRAARGTSAWLRAEAAKALGKFDATEALPDLRTLLSDTSQHVRNCAATAIEAITRPPTTPPEPTGGMGEEEIPF